MTYDFDSDRWYGAFTADPGSAAGHVHHPRRGPIALKRGARRSSAVLRPAKTSRPISPRAKEMSALPHGHAFCADACVAR